MEDEVRKQFKRRGIFWFITRLIALIFFGGLSYFTIIENYVFIVIFLIINVSYIMVLVTVPFSYMKQTAEKIKDMDFHVDWWINDGYSYLMIDTHNGKIATVWTTYPFKIQMVDASELVDAKIILGVKLKIRKTTSKIGVRYKIGKRKYYTYSYCAGWDYVRFTSEEGQKYIREAESYRDKLFLAREVALLKDKNPVGPRENLLSKEIIR